MKKDCILCDIDGVFTDSREWYKYFPKNGNREIWNAFQAKCDECCPPNKPFINYLKETYKDKYIVFFTAREATEYLVEATTRQIHDYSDGYFTVGDNCDLVMRPLNNFIEDYKVKELMLEKYIFPKYNVLLAIDDNIDNINMFKSKGIEVYWYMELLEE